VPGEPAYDWTMPGGKPIVSVADGIVRGSRDREVGVEFPSCGPDLQREVYVEHQVGEGVYAERFVTYYAHLDTRAVGEGQRVARGETLGLAGTTGCSSGDHLHLSVYRLSNLSGSRAWNFALTPGGHGTNGIHGVIDPFGWAGPQHIDPWGWMFLGRTFNDRFAGTVRDPGAFSINLWQPGQVPPSEWVLTAVLAP